MGLFDKNQTTEQEEAQTGHVGVDFLDEVAGAGLDTLQDPSTRAITYLNITADLSQSVKDGLCKPGEWYLSGFPKGLGKTIQVVPLGVKSIWEQRDKSGTRVRTGDVHGFPVKETKTDKGYLRYVADDGTNDEVVELLLYAFLIPDYPTLGPVLFTAGLGSIKACRRWNALLYSQLLPNGKPAPIFSKAWELEIGEFPSKQKAGAMYFAVKSATPKDFISRGAYIEVVKPAFETRKALLLAPAETLALPDSGDGAAEEQGVPVSSNVLR